LGFSFFLTLPLSNVESSNHLQNQISTLSMESAAKSGLIDIGKKKDGTLIKEYYSPGKENGGGPEGTGVSAEPAGGR